MPEILAEISDAVQIITLIAGLITTIFAGVLTYCMAKLKIIADQAATKVEEVKQALERSNEASREPEIERTDKFE